MKKRYTSELTAVLNGKGVLDIDTVKGCELGVKANPKGCYDACYAKRLADAFGIDFSVSVSRGIKSRKPLTDAQMQELGNFGVILNTSISPMDTNAQILYRLQQYNRYKSFGTSVLRIVSCEFNLEHPEGERMNNTQIELFKNENIIDNPFRVSTGHALVKEGVIKIKKVWDLNSYVSMSKFNDDTFVGRCILCKELCGVEFKLNSK